MDKHTPASAAPSLDDLAERFSVLPCTEVFATFDMLRDMLIARCDNPLDAIDGDDKPKNRHERRRAKKLARRTGKDNPDPDPVPECKHPPGYDADRDAYDIAAFCHRHSISVSGFYQMKREGWGPATFYVGKRQLISREAAARWRREREEAAANI